MGLAPAQAEEDSYEGPLFFEELARAGLIKRGVFGLFVSRFESEPHSIQIGDYDTRFVEGTDEASLDWYTIHIGSDGTFRWWTDLTGV